MRATWSGTKTGTEQAPLAQAKAAASGQSKQKMIAVGTAVAGGPRTDPYVKNYLIRLLPWVRTSRPRLAHWSACAYAW